MAERPTVQRRMFERELLGALMARTNRLLPWGSAVAVLVVALGVAFAVHARTKEPPCYPTATIVKDPTPMGKPAPIPSIMSGGSFQLIGPGGCPSGTLKTTTATVWATYAGLIPGGHGSFGSRPGSLGAVEVASTGALAVTLRLPADAPPGWFVYLLFRPYPYPPCPRGASCAASGSTLRVATTRGGPTAPA